MQSIKLAGILCRSAQSATKLVRHLSTPGVSGKIYELRFYQMKPEFYKESLELLAKYWSVRTAHSKDIGSWMTEIGAICETVHLWEYEGLADRFKKRLNVAQDEVWQKEFLPKFFEKSFLLNCVLLKPQPGTEVRTDFSPSDTAVYELQKSDPYTPIVHDKDGEITVGQFTTIYGPRSTEYILMRYTEPDFALERAFHRRKATGVRGYSRLMVPCSWSPIQ